MIISKLGEMHARKRNVAGNSNKRIQEGRPCSRHTKLAG